MKRISLLTMTFLMASTAFSGELNYSLDPEVPTVVENEINPRAQQGSSGGSAGGWIIAIIILAGIGYAISQNQEELGIKN